MAMYSDTLTTLYALHTSEHGDCGAASQCAWYDALALASQMVEEWESLYNERHAFLNQEAASRETVRALRQRLKERASGGDDLRAEGSSSPALVSVPEDGSSPAFSDHPPCQGCGGPHRFDTSVPSPLWNRIIRDGGLPDYLCTSCIVEAFVLAGESFTAELYGASVNREHFVPTIAIQVGERSITDTYGDLDYRNCELQARLAQVEGERAQHLEALALKAVLSDDYRNEIQKQVLRDSLRERDALRAQLAERDDACVWHDKKIAELESQLAAKEEAARRTTMEMAVEQAMLKEQLAAMGRVVEAAKGLMSDFRHNGIVKHYHPTATRLRDALDALSTLRETGGSK